MTINAKRMVFYKVLALGGFHAFLFTLGIDNPLVIFSCVLMTLGLAARILLKKHYLHLLTPMAAGLLVLPLKLIPFKTHTINLINHFMLITALMLSILLILKLAFSLSGKTGLRASKKKNG